MAAEDPIGLLALPEAAGLPRFFWSAARGGDSIAAIGAVETAAGRGPDRFDVVRDAMRARAATVAAGADESAPRWVGGFSFEEHVDDSGAWSGFEAASFVLPWAAVLGGPDGARLVVAGHGEEAKLRSRARRLAERLARTAVTPTADAAPGEPSRLAWSEIGEEASRERVLRRVELALGAIDAGVASKVVVGATRTVHVGRLVDPLRLVSALRSAQPDSYHFLVSPRPRVALVGASPERLVRVDGDQLETTALAGTAPREADPEADRLRASELLDSLKVRREHEAVVRTVRRALEDAGYALSPQRAPTVRKLSTVQHLETPIRARAGRKLDLLEEAARLHPTPALGGLPREAALELVGRLEGSPRGWFGGGVGWVTASGDGEVAVAIRSLLVRDGTVTAFAGAGIVAGSDPAEEAAEIRLKLAVALQSLER